MRTFRKEDIGVRLCTKSRKIRGCIQKSSNAESVGECQPRVCLETLGSEMPEEISRNPEGVGRLRGQQGADATLSELRLQ
jgi:hypothetical protein